MLKTFVLLSNLLVATVCFSPLAKVLDADISFQAVHRIGPNIWASGTNGSIYNSQDNGRIWRKIAGPENTQDLQFRDIQPLEDGSVVLMSAGEGSLSRIYRSDTAVKNWQLQIQGSAPETFYDCMHFSDSQHGWLYGDSDKEGLFILATDDGGDNWQRQKLSIKAQEGEGGFASSGTCLNKGQDTLIYIGTGNALSPRILIHSNQTWQSLDVPWSGGEAAGVFSVQQYGMWLYAFGGSLKEEDKPAKIQRYNLKTKQWSDLPEVPFKGAIYGSSLINVGKKTHVLIANPQGVSVWYEGQSAWTTLSTHNIWSLSCEYDMGCIGVGKDGVVESFTFP
jgi:hypothetical protein